jgi:hypothetical protein
MSENNISVERDFVGTLHIKVGDFDYVQIQYQHPFTDNASTRALADRIVAFLAQPAVAEGVSNSRLMNTLAELARRAPLRTLHTICETQRQVSTVKLERYLGPIGDTLAGYAFTLRIDFGKLSAALSAVTAERDAANSRLHEVAVACATAEQERDQLRAEVERIRNELAGKPLVC